MAATRSPHLGARRRGTTIFDPAFCLFEGVEGAGHLVAILVDNDPLTAFGLFKFHVVFLVCAPKVRSVRIATSAVEFDAVHSCYRFGPRANFGIKSEGRPSDPIPVADT